MSIVKETPRLRMRPFREDDLDDLCRLFADPDVMRYISHGQPRTRDETIERLHRMIGHWRDHGLGMWALFDRTDGRFIGRCGLQPLPGTEWIELGYTLLKDAWGKGYATEAAKASVRFAFEELKLPYIVSIAIPENRASTHVMEKCGLRYERTAPHSGINEIVWYSLTIEEYQERNRTRPTDG